MAEFMPLIMFLCVCLVLLSGYPVAFSLGGTALAFALIGQLTGTFDQAFLSALPNRLYGIMTNVTLIAVPLFAKKLLFQIEIRAATRGMFLSSGALRACKSMASAPFKNSSKRSYPKYKLRGTPPTAEVTLYLPPIKSNM